MNNLGSQVEARTRRSCSISCSGSQLFEPVDGSFGCKQTVVDILDLALFGSVGSRDFSRHYRTVSKARETCGLYVIDLNALDQTVASLQYHHGSTPKEVSVVAPISLLI
jgi:hypothetical protein